MILLFQMSASSLRQLSIFSEPASAVASPESTATAATPPRRIVNIFVIFSPLVPGLTPGRQGDRIVPRANALEPPVGSRRRLAASAGPASIGGAAGRAGMSPGALRCRPDSNLAVPPRALAHG